MSEVSASELEQLLTGKMGLVIGPGVTNYYGSFDDLTNTIAARAKITPAGNYLETCDSLLDTGMTEQLVCEWVREALQAQPPSTLLGRLSKVRWSAILSACLDSHFEEALQRESLKHPT